MAKCNQLTSLPFKGSLMFLCAQDSYIALFPNFGERAPSDYRYADPLTIDACDADQSMLIRTPSSRVMPADYFMLLELSIAPSDLYIQTDGRASAGGAISSTVGFR